MASKDKKPAPKKPSSSQTKVTRIVASDGKKKVVKTKPVSRSPKPSAPRPGTNPLGRLATPFVAIARYFKGAWYELRQVRWPNRKATWSLTGAMLVFTAFFVVLILVLDALFKYLFQLILG